MEEEVKKNVTRIEIEMMGGGGSMTLEQGDGGGLHAMNLYDDKGNTVESLRTRDREAFEVFRRRVVDVVIPNEILGFLIREEKK